MHLACHCIMCLCCTSATPGSLHAHADAGEAHSPGHGDPWVAKRVVMTGRGSSLSPRSRTSSPDRAHNSAAHDTACSAAGGTAGSPQKGGAAGGGKRLHRLPSELQEQLDARAALLAANPELAERRKALSHAAFVRCGFHHSACAVVCSCRVLWCHACACARSHAQLCSRACSHA